MAASIQDYKLPHSTHKLYDVISSTHRVHTLVTHTPDLVDRWIAKMRQNITIVGLDVVWRPNVTGNYDNPIATLQLPHLPHFSDHPFSYHPQSLADFLDSARHTFVGLGIDADVKKLYCGYGLGVRNVVDLRDLLTSELMSDLKNVGWWEVAMNVRELAMCVLDIDIDKLTRFTMGMGSWDNRWLSPDQVQHACRLAFIYYSIGKMLNDIMKSLGEYC